MLVVICPRETPTSSPTWWQRHGGVVAHNQLSPVTSTPSGLSPYQPRSRGERSVSRAGLGGGPYLQCAERLT
jgi:hypothetical protein